MQLACRSCGKELHPRDVDFASLRASCRQCGWQIGGTSSAYRRREPEPPPTSDTPQPPPPPSAAERLPHYITTRPLGERGLDILIQPHAPWRFLLVIASVVFGAVAILASQPRLMVAALVLVGSVPVVWVVGALFMNTRRIRVHPRTLEITYRPFHRPPLRLRVEDVDQFYVDEHVQDKGVYSYRLCVRLRRGRTFDVLTDLPDPTAALQLEKMVEELWGIEDDHVAGSFKPYYAQLAPPAAESE